MHQIQRKEKNCKRPTGPVVTTGTKQSHFLKVHIQTDLKKKVPLTNKKIQIKQGARKFMYFIKTKVKTENTGYQQGK